MGDVLLFLMSPDCDSGMDVLSKELKRDSISQPLGGAERNMGLIRMIYDEARRNHMQRLTYQARLADPEMKVPPREVLAEVCADIRIAVRRCLNVFKPIRFMYIEAQRTAQRRQDVLEKVHARLPRVRLKVIFI